MGDPDQEDLLLRHGQAHRYLVLMLLITVLLTATTTAVVMASVKGESAPEQRVLRLSDGSLLFVAGSDSGFAREIECDSMNSCHPITNSSTDRRLHTYLLTGVARPASATVGVFGFRVGSSGSSNTYLGCVTGEHDAYQCEAMHPGDTVPRGDTGIYVQE